MKILTRFFCTYAVQKILSNIYIYIYCMMAESERNRSQHELQKGGNSHVTGERPRGARSYPSNSIF
jgi:hypothetical protein